MSYSAELTRVADARRSISDILKSIEQVSNDLVFKVGNDIVDQAKINITLNGNVVTGTLRGSIRILKEGPDYVMVGTDISYAPFVEYGRGPVVPIHAKALHWFDPVTGREVFSQYSGPTDPSPFMAPAVEQVVAQYKTLIGAKYG